MTYHGLYKVVRFYENAGIRRRVMAEYLTLEQAQTHCQDPETSSSTCTKPANVRRTRTLGRWFDAYEKM